MTVLRDPLTYSLEHGYQDRYANGFVDELAEIMNRDGGGFIRDIIACDPPGHTRLRRLLEKAFTAHRVKALEPGVRQIVKIGRASCRERVCQYVEIPVVAVTLKK